MTFKLAVKTACAEERPARHVHAQARIRHQWQRNAYQYVPVQGRQERILRSDGDPRGLSKEAYSVYRGTARPRSSAMAAITNPLVNSYKRLVPGYEAPCYLAWSASQPLRADPNSRRARTGNPRGAALPRIRRATPYLTLAVCLAAGLDGIEKGMTPPGRNHR